MTKLSVSLLAAAFAVAAVPAFAADLPRGVVAEPAPAAPTSNTISVEFSPEFTALSDVNGNHPIADWYGKGMFSHNLGQGLSAAIAFQDTLKTSGLSQQYYEGSLAYKLAVSSNFSFTVTGTLGYTAGNTGFAGGIPLSSGTDAYLYYAIAGAADWKIDSHWTWNVINARYRNAFDRTWQTPKVTTGVTYNIDATDAVYANVGYSWKDTGAGYAGDKINFAVGYKYSF